VSALRLWEKEAEMQFNDQLVRARQVDILLHAREQARVHEARLALGSSESSDRFRVLVRFAQKVGERTRVAGERLGLPARPEPTIDVTRPKVA